MERLATLLRKRFNQGLPVPRELETVAYLRTMAGRSSCRQFKPEEIPESVIRVLCAVALSSPTKSDLQQRDIVVISNPMLKEQLVALLSDQEWTINIPTLLVFCGNNRRQRRLHKIRGQRFANDHLDAFFNAVVDASVALGAFINAAEAVGLGCCPISAVRNHPEKVDQLVGLPDHVFSVAGLALGYPEEPTPISQRLPLDVTLHYNLYDDSDFRERTAEYDRQRALQNRSEIWSETKVRQYSTPVRTAFGEYIKKKGFRLG